MRCLVEGKTELTRHFVRPALDADELRKRFEPGVRDSILEGKSERVLQEEYGETQNG